ELGELARGLHPRVLTESGLAAALEQLAARLPFRVEVDATERPLPPAVAAAAYYLCSEGLANAAKHADPTAVRVAAGLEEGRLAVAVEDDGAGGAHIARGSGLRGLADRVEALGGELLVRSDPGCGTLLRAEI